MGGWSVLVSGLQVMLWFSDQLPEFLEFDVALVSREQVPIMLRGGQFYKMYTKFFLECVYQGAKRCSQQSVFPLGSSLFIKHVSTVSFKYRCSVYSLKDLISENENVLPEH